MIYIINLLFKICFEIYILIVFVTIIITYIIHFSDFISLCQCFYNITSPLSVVIMIDVCQLENIS